MLSGHIYRKCPECPETGSRPVPARRRLGGWGEPPGGAGLSALRHRQHLGSRKADLSPCRSCKLEQTQGSGRWQWWPWGGGEGAAPGPSGHTWALSPPGHDRWTPATLFPLPQPSSLPIPSQTPVRGWGAAFRKFWCPPRAQSSDIIGLSTGAVGEPRLCFTTFYFEKRATLGSVARMMQ